MMQAAAMRRRTWRQTALPSRRRGERIGQKRKLRNKATQIIEKQAAATCVTTKHPVSGFPFHAASGQRGGRSDGHEAVLPLRRVGLLGAEHFERLEEAPARLARQNGGVRE